MKLIKGIFLAIVAFILAQTQTSGLPTDFIGWEVLGLSALGTGIAYFGQSFLLPTTSKFLGLDTNDLIKGGILALGTFLSQIGADKLLGTVTDIKTVLLGSLAILATYMGKQFVTVLKPAQ